MFRRKRVTGDVETPGDRAAMARDAGFGSVSIASTFAGTLVAFATAVILLALSAAVAGAAGVNVDIQSNNWRDAGMAGAAILAGVLLVSYLFGGYTAGRMARRRGVLHGVLVVVTTLVALATATVIARLMTDADADTILRNLRSVGVPTTGNEWRDVATGAAIASLAAMLIGSVLGGRVGDRWHTRLLRRAVDPDIGPEASLRRDADAAHDDAATRVERHRIGGGVDLRDRLAADERADDTIVQDAEARR